MGRDAGTVRVDGLNALVRDLQRLGVDVDDLKEAFAGIAQQAATVAAGFAPKRSGRLAASIRGNRAKSKAVVAAGSARAVPYAGAINYGWPARNIAGREFMQKTDKVMEPVAVVQLDRDITRLIKKRGLRQ